MNLQRSQIQFEFFCIAFLVCIMAIWFSTIVKKDYIVFTDPETVPDPTDFFAEVPTYLQGLWIR